MEWLVVILFSLGISFFAYCLHIWMLQRINRRLQSLTMIFLAHTRPEDMDEWRRNRLAAAVKRTWDM